MTTQKTFIKTYIVQQSIGEKNISRYVISWNTRNWMWPLIEENKLQFDEKNSKNWKNWKMFEKVYHKF